MVKRIGANWKRSLVLMVGVALLGASLVLGAAESRADEPQEVAAEAEAEAAELGESAELSTSLDSDFTVAVSNIRFYSVSAAEGSNQIAADVGTTFCALSQKTVNINLRADSNIFPSCVVSLRNGGWFLTASNPNNHAGVTCGMVCFVD